jgi:hypothetical protein
MSFFHLFIEDRLDGTFKVSEGRDVGSSTSVTPTFYEGFQTDLKNLRGRGADGPLIYKSQRAIATRVGQALFTSFFPQPVRDRFNEYRKTQVVPRLALHSSHSLFAYPWEVLRDPADQGGIFLSLVGSVVRCYDSDSPESDASSLIQKERLKLFAVSSNPKDRPVLGDVEWRSYKQIKFDKVKPATFDRFKIKIQSDAECDGFVFWGHGDIDSTQGFGTLVFLERVPGLRNILSYRSHQVLAFNLSLEVANSKAMRVAYVFACQSASWESTGLEFPSSIVGSLLDGTQLAFVVGVQTQIDVNAAGACLDGCLDAIRANPRLPFDLAIRNGRRKILEIAATNEQKFSPLDWWVPVVYVKPGFLEKLAGVTLPSDPTQVEIPSPPPTASAAPSGGLEAAQHITGADAAKNVLLNAVTNVLS